MNSVPSFGHHLHHSEASFSPSTSSDNLLEADVVPIVKCKTGIICLHGGRVILYSEDSTENMQLSSPLSKLLLFSHQIKGNPSNISKEDIQATQLYGETFLTIVGEFFYFSESDKELILLSDHFLPDNTVNFSYTQVSGGIVIQKGSRALLKLENDDIFYTLQIGAQETVASYENGFLRTINSHNLSQTEVHLGIEDRTFFSFTDIQNQIDVVATEDEKALIFQNNIDIINQRLSYFVHTYGASENFSTRLCQGKVQVTFFGGEDTQRFDIAYIEVQVARLICAQRAQDVYNKAFPEAEVSACFYGAKLIVTCRFGRNSVVYYDAGTLGKIHHPEDSLLLDSGEVEIYKNLFSSEGNTEKINSAKEAIKLYTFKEYEFVVENGTFNVYKQTQNMRNISSTLDISLNPVSCTADQLYSFMGVEVSHEFQVCAGNLFLILSYPDNTQIVYRFSPEEGKFFEELNRKTTKKVTIQNVDETDFFPGFMMFHRVKVGDGAGIFIGKKQYSFFPINLYSQSISSTHRTGPLNPSFPSNQHDSIGREEKESIDSEMFNIDMFQDFSTVSDGKKIFTIQESGEKTEVREVGSDGLFYLIGEYLYISQGLQEGKKVLKKSHISLGVAHNIALYQEDGQIGLLHLEAQKSVGYLFDENIGDFQKVEADIQYFGEIGSWKFVRVDATLYALEKRDNMLVSVHSQTLPENTEFFDVVNDMGTPVMDIKTKGNSSNVQRYYFNARTAQFSMDSFSSRLEYQFGHPSGDVHIGDFSGKKLYRNADALVFHSTHSIATSKFTFSGRVDIQTFGGQDILFGETVSGSGEYIMYRFNETIGDIEKLGKKVSTIPHISRYFIENELLVVENSLLDSQYLLYTFDFESGDFKCVGLRDTLSDTEIIFSGTVPKGRGVIKRFASGDFVFFETHFGSSEFFCQQYREGRYVRDLDGVFVSDGNGSFEKKELQKAV